MRRMLLFFISLILILTLYRGWRDGREIFPIEYGVSFSPKHATWLGLDWREAYTALLTDLKPRYIRLSVLWNEVQADGKQYDFADLDWMMDEAGKNGTRVTLVIGQKAPRWPECYTPLWWHGDKEALLQYVATVVKRYAPHPAMEFWQVENEPYIIFSFGSCGTYHQEFVPDEIAMVRSLDAMHKIIITDSGELGLWRRANKTGDYFGTTVYRVVRSKGGRVWKYDWFPAVLYRWRAELWKRDFNTFFVSELQAEPWFHDGSPSSTPVAIQEETMNPERLRDHLEFVTHIGAARAYLWGAEWWYWMRTVKGDNRYWDMVKQLLAS